MPGDDPGSAVTRPTRARTRGVTGEERTAEVLEREENTRKSVTVVKDSMTARSYLESKCLLIQGAQYTLESLRVALLYITQTPGVPKSVQEGMRAIAYVMRDIQSRTGAEAIIEAVKSQLDESTQRMSDATAGVVEAAAEVRKAAREAQEQLITRTPQVAGTTPPTGGTPRCTYADAAAGACSLNPTHAAVLAKSEIKARQVLVDVHPEAKTNPLADMMERVLVAKANIALEGLEGDWQGHGAVVGVKKLRNGGVIYEM
ncbi:hypothetical protein JB92DRAFT_3117760 [Gautieria morchelliformis]|nr:hypothetical protein JB92DRAFT_3117760 [Gautieria morchelliformis]